MRDMKIKTENEQNENENVRMNAQDTRRVLAMKIVKRVREDLESLERLITNETEQTDIEALLTRSETMDGTMLGPAEGTMLEGVFDGQHMVGSDGRQYVVPPNYASKSKLVEGDILKLTIQPNGTFLYKQIGPIERQRVMGTLVRDEFTSDWCVGALGKKYHILSAAVSFYKGSVGDDAVILIPKSAPSRWAALENVIKRAG